MIDGFSVVSVTTRRRSSMTTKERIFELRASGLRPAQIARELGISRQRVSQLIGPIGRTPSPNPVCTRCGSEFKREFGALTVCRTCHAARGLVLLTCPTCGNPFTRYPGDIRNRMKLRASRNSNTGIFCSPSCSLSWRHRKNQ